MRIFVTISLLGIGLAVLILAGSLIYVATTFGPDTSTDVADYADICRNKWQHPDLIRHFPAVIPEDASHVKMSYSAAVLQGGAHLQLCLNLPNAEFEKEVAKFSGSEQLKFTGGDTNDHANLDGGAPTTIFYTSDGTTKFSDDYTILLLYIRPSIEEARKLEEQGPFWWNHGDNYGVAYNEDTHTVVYWAESW